MTTTGHPNEKEPTMTMPKTIEGLRAELDAQKKWRRKQSSSVMKLMAAKRILELEAQLDEMGSL